LRDKKVAFTQNCHTGEKGGNCGQTQLPGAGKREAGRMVGPRLKTKKTPAQNGMNLARSASAKRGIGHEKG